MILKCQENKKTETIANECGIKKSYKENIVKNKFIRGRIMYLYMAVGVNRGIMMFNGSEKGWALENFENCVWGLGEEKNLKLMRKRKMNKVFFFTSH